MDMCIMADRGMGAGTDAKVKQRAIVCNGTGAEKQAIAGMRIITDLNRINRCFAGSLRNNSSGSATVEHAVILPLLILLVIILLHVAVLLHDQAVLQAYASDSAESLARTWRCGDNPQNWGLSGDWSPQAAADRHLYWQLSAALTGDAGRASAAAEQLASQLVSGKEISGYRTALLGKGDLNVSVRYHAGIPFGTVRVEIMQTSRSPAKRIPSLLGWGGGRRIQVSAESLVTDPRSLMQDVDWGLQVLQDTGAGKLAKRIAGPIRSFYGKALRSTSGTREED